MESKNKIDPDKCSHKYDDGHYAFYPIDRKYNFVCLLCGRKFNLPYYLAPRRVKEVGTVSSKISYRYEYPPIPLNGEGYYEPLGYSEEELYVERILKIAEMVGECNKQCTDN